MVAQDTGLVAAANHAQASAKPAIIFFLLLVPCYVEGPMLCAEGVLMSLTRSVFLEPRLWLYGMVQGEITFFQGDTAHQSLNHCHYSVLMWDTQTPEHKWATNLNMNIQEFLESYYYICPSRGQLKGIKKNPRMLETRANQFGSFCQKINQYHVSTGQNY